jgi:hypothetical protein
MVVKFLQLDSAIQVRNDGTLERPLDGTEQRRNGEVWPIFDLVTKVGQRARRAPLPACRQCKL